jgi:exodeoxyribonuclease VII small subunit
MSDPLPTNLTFEQALAELERLVRQLEDGQTGLEEALAQYEQGIGLLKSCYGQLSQAEQRILLLSGTDAEGRPLTEPFEHRPTGAEAPKRRRKAAEGEAALKPLKQPEMPFP